MNKLTQVQINSLCEKIGALIDRALTEALPDEEHPLVFNLMIGQYMSSTMGICGNIPISDVPVFLRHFAEQIEKGLQWKVVKDETEN